MAVPAYRLFIDGQSVDTCDHYELHYPFNGEVVGTVARAGERKPTRRSRVRRAPMKNPAALGARNAPKFCSAMSRGVAERRGDFQRAITLGTGKPIDYARAEVGRTVASSRSPPRRSNASGKAVTDRLEAANKGSVGIVERSLSAQSPRLRRSDFPLNLVTHKVAPAIADRQHDGGQAAAAMSGPAVMLAELAAEAGCPGAAQRHLGRPAGRERLAVDERIKSVELHRQREGRMGAAAMAGTKRVALELGGNGGLIVDDGADLEYAADAHSAPARWCTRPGLSLGPAHLVHRHVCFAFLKHLVDATERLGIGDPHGRAPRWSVR